MGALVLTHLRRVCRPGLPLVLLVASVSAAIGLTSVAGRTAGSEAHEVSAESTPAIEPPVSRRAAPREEMVRPVEVPRALGRPAAGSARRETRPGTVEPSRATPLVATVAEPAAKPAPAEKSATSDLIGVGSKLLLGSLLLAGLLYAAARLVRRMPIAKLLANADGPIKVIGRTHLGPKASLVLVQAEGATILIALTGSGVQTLHTWSTPGAGAPALDQQAAKGSRPGAPAPALPAQLRGLANRLTEGR